MVSLISPVSPTPCCLNFLPNVNARVRSNYTFEHFKPISMTLGLAALAFVNHNHQQHRQHPVRQSLIQAKPLVRPSDIFAFLAVFTLSPSVSKLHNKARRGLLLHFEVTQLDAILYNQNQYTTLVFYLLTFLHLLPIAAELRIYKK